MRCKSLDFLMKTLGRSEILDAIVAAPLVLQCALLMGSTQQPITIYLSLPYELRALRQCSSLGNPQWGWKPRPMHCAILPSTGIHADTRVAAHIQIASALGTLSAFSVLTLYTC